MSRFLSLTFDGPGGTAAALHQYERDLVIRMARDSMIENVLAALPETTVRSFVLGDQEARERVFLHAIDLACGLAISSCEPFRRATERAVASDNADSPAMGHA